MGRIPINSTQISPEFVIQRLFKLIILHHVTDSGVRYQVTSEDSFLIELPTKLTISGDELEATMMGGVDLQSMSVDTRFWFCSVNAGLPRQNITQDNNPLVLEEEEQFVLKYLRAFKKRTTVQYGGLRGSGRDDDPDFDPYDETVPPITMEIALQLLDQYCPGGKTSRICQKNFLRFMHTQLVQIHANIYLMNWNSPQPGQIHLREMVIESMVMMSQDFSSKLYTAGDGIEDSKVQDKFPLSERWRNTEIPMVLLN